MKTLRDSIVPRPYHPRTLRPLVVVPLAWAAALLAACADVAHLPTAPATGVGPRLNVAPVGVAQLLVTALNSNVCVDDDAGKTAPGTIIQVWSCYGGPNQQFAFGAGGQLTPASAPSACLTVTGAQGQDGDPVVLAACAGGANQVWTVTNAGQVVGVNGKCLDIPSGNVTNGTRLQIWTCLAGDNNQRWTLRDVVSGGVGSAELPRTYLDTPMPAVTGQTITVPAGGDLQAALNLAQPGDQVVLAAGAKYVGNFVLPVKSGASTGQWITVRTSGSLPAEGTRVGPADAPQMAAILTQSEGAALATAPGAQGWRLTGLEVGATGAQDLVYSILALGDAGTNQQTAAQIPARLVLDRSYVHGTSALPVYRCIALNSAMSAVIDSYLTDCHRKGDDSQAILGWNGPGPYKIVNNHLEGAAEVIMFGGADPTVSGNVPADIEIRRNHITRPTSWKGVWTVKNLLELKMGQRVLIEGNVLENNWVDGQSGQALVFSSNDQNGGCTWCITSDVTFRYNIVRNTPSGFSLADHGSNGAVYPSQAMRRVTIVHNLVLGVAEQGGRMFQTSGGIDGLTISNNSAIGGNNDLLFVTSNPLETLPTFVYRNNVTGGTYLMPTDNGNGGGTQAIAYMQIPTGNVTGNVFLNTSYGYTAPPNNTYGPASGAGFADYAGGDLTLTASSPYLTAGTGGTRPGADMATLKAATGGVVR